MTNKEFEYIEDFIEWYKGKNLPLNEALATYGMEKREGTSEEDIHELASALVSLSLYYPLIYSYVETLISVLQNSKK